MAYNLSVCPDCKELSTRYGWCNQCDPGKCLKGKTSGDFEIDNFIYESHLKTYSYDSALEWISYNRFQDIKQIGEGGFSDVFSAIWLDGKPKIDIGARGMKARSEPITVALKKLKILDDETDAKDAFINECKAHHDCNCFPWFIKFYGITKDPQTEEFIMVLEYAGHGDLKTYLKENILNLKWYEKLDILYGISLSLNNIQQKNYVHKDLHSGNILQFAYEYSTDAKITDLGQAQRVNNSNTSSESFVCGVLPYIAPEVLDGKPYTKASDIYSFGIIMVEVSTGRPPYETVAHDGKLALAICNGLRPRVAKGTPQCYINLINRCLDANPEKRPLVREVYGLIHNWRDNDAEGFNIADEMIPRESPPKIRINSEAIYTSRSMKFTNLSKPINSSRVQVEDIEVSDSQLVDLHVSDKFRSKSILDNMDDDLSI